jgi:hypothetical protein
MPDPAEDLASDPQRFGRAVRGGNVAREFLVREVGIVVELARRLDDVMRPRSSPLASSAPQIAASRLALK